MKRKSKLLGKIKSVTSSYVKMSRRLEETQTNEPNTYSNNIEWENEYYNGDCELANKLLNQLMKDYDDMLLNDHFGGEEVTSKQGTAYCITDKFKNKMNKYDINKVKVEVLSDFTLINGIGDKIEATLKKDYKTLYDLADHPKYGAQATKIIKNIDKNVESFLDVIPSKPATRPTILKNAKCHDLNDFVVYDIETMGLSGVPIILFGMAFISEDEINTKQFFLRNLDEEYPALHYTLSELQNRKAIISFNGKSFDMSRTIERLDYYGLYNYKTPKIHYDLLHFSRKAWKEQLPNITLQTIEQHVFNYHRVDDVPSKSVPKFYKTYLETNNIGPLIPIIEHNKTDLVTTAKILNTLWEMW